MIQPLLSIIIVSYNTADLTINCLESIFQDKGLEFDLTQTKLSNSKSPTEIIVIDNNSTDNTLSRIRRLKYSVKIIQNKTNTGFGRANNQGIKIARGNYLLLLNSDTLILHSSISQTLDWLSSHPESYGCTAQLLNHDKSIQPSGGYFLNLSNVTTWCLGLDDLPFINHLIKPFHPHPPQFYTHDRYYLTDHPQDWITGAFILIRKNIIDSVSGFDESYFMYGEEMEMFYRIHQRFPQLSLWYLVGPQIIHLGGGSAKSKSEIFNREYQGIQAFFSKHRPHLLAIVNHLISINRFLHRTIYPLIQKRV